MLVALLKENTERCRPPLEPAEVKRIAKSVHRYPPDPKTVAESSSTEPDWHKQLRINKKRHITRSPGNAAILLANRSEWQGTLQYDDFGDEILWIGDAPGGVGPSRPLKGEPMRDVHLGYVQHWLAKNAGPDFSDGAVSRAIESAARTNIIHPVRAYLESITWDGKDRLADWTHTYCGAERNEYHQAVSTWWMISAVARIFDPGCQADHVLILESRTQGMGKSQAVRALAFSDVRDRNWFLPQLPDIRNKDAGHALQGSWICEIGELDAIKGVGATRVKDFISRPVDKYRPSYGRYFVTRPRQCVFVGTTNEEAYLTDASGARRFWPVKCTEDPFDIELLKMHRDQLWAEAVHRYRDGEQWWPTPELTGLVREQTEDRYAIDDWHNKVETYLFGKDSVTTEQVLEHGIGMELARIEHRHSFRIGKIMRQIGWIKARIPVGGKPKRGYRKFNS
jgi:putative DNA primase/helicase